ncbi:hypothetical protein [Sphingomonas sp.]|uniref:hypothetical protein n=1 Tax=Sphingomonas sp. TaxID=28214 RepID=UPI001EBEE637|nr:hypothetical protein [Sphingomonas sp.]MBX3593695.1 hypothetical protein [Sphingomonas sp.]
MTTMPPSRYRVIEKDRRLIVIDTETGQQVTHGGPVAPAAPTRDRAPAGDPLSRRTRTVDDRSGSGVIRTSRLYDDKGPRDIVVGPNGTGMLGSGAAVAMIVGVVFVGIAIAFPAILLVPALLFVNPKARKAIRSAVTVWLDSIDQAGGSPDSAG